MFHLVQTNDIMGYGIVLHTWGWHGNKMAGQRFGLTY